MALSYIMSTQSEVVLRKNSFNNQLIIVTRTKMENLFPSIGNVISNHITQVRRHYSGTAQFADDLQARVLESRELQVRRKGEEWKTRAVLPVGTYVVGYGRLK
jgi:hypothetical protein